MANVDEREEELCTLAAIYPELTLDPNDSFSVHLELPVTPTKPLLVRFIPSQSPKAPVKHLYPQVVNNSAAYIERDVEITHLPPIYLQLILPKQYPASLPPTVRLSTKYDWLPGEKVNELEREIESLWEEYGRCQILFAYIDYLQQAAERGFDLDQSAQGCLVLPVSAESDLLTFDVKTKQDLFNAGTYDCGICLEPKKGAYCYQIKKCGHVFCRQCLQDFYNNAIDEGDVANVKCLSPDCGKESVHPGKRKRKSERRLHPRELLDMGVEESKVRRYVEMKRKKRLEADKGTVYCPRTWCQGPARSAKYPPIPADLSAYPAAESSSEDESDEAAGGDAPQESSNKNNSKNIPPNPNDRLAVCEKCSFAFCKVCYMGWHGPFARCFPRDPSELSAEEKASYDYIRLNTSPCPYCNSPTQKTMGCNHMKCFTCNTHFCYLCGSWLDGNQPYGHFNKPGTGCFQRLWELEGGDEGQAPGDGRGFAGGRGWEQLAIEAAREAEAQEAAAAAQAEEDERTARAAEAQNLANDLDDVPIEIIMAHIALANEREPGQAGQRQNNGPPRARNAFQARAPGAANAVRNHERNRAGGNGQARQRAAARTRPAPLNDEERHQQEIQRFVEMAGRDEEDGWDSDDLGDDDEGFVIR